MWSVAGRPGAVVDFEAASESRVYARSEVDGGQRKLLKWLADERQCARVAVSFRLNHIKYGLFLSKKMSSLKNDIGLSQVGCLH